MRSTYSFTPQEDIMPKCDFCKKEIEEKDYIVAICYSYCFYLHRNCWENRTEIKIDYTPNRGEMNYACG